MAKLDDAEGLDDDLPTRPGGKPHLTEIELDFEDLDTSIWTPPDELLRAWHSC
ncbi:MAG: hypothetical protein ACXVEE_10870 [Polyangiales bacterium]